MAAPWDVVVVGAGFGGAVLARALAARGRRVLLVERGRHPRFALGESATPLAALALERLAARHGLDDLAALAAAGRWRHELAEIPRGHKRGFTFYGHRPGARFDPGPGNRRRLLVAASPDDEVADSHWLRSAVDHHMVRRARAEGVTVWEEVELDALELAGDRVRVAGRAPDGARSAAARFLVDASGPGGFLARCLPLAPRPAATPPTALLYGHFEGVGRFTDAARAAGAALEPGPYDDDDAAVHHLLAEGWLYVLRFAAAGAAGPARASAGFVLHREAARRLAAAAPEPLAAFRALLGRYPTLAAQLATAEPVRQVAWREPVAHRLDPPAGDRWLLLPHVHAFFDPLFSTGIAWTLVAVERAAELLGADLPPDRAALGRYADRLRAEAAHLERLVALAWALLDDFPRFAAASHLYFAAASFCEARQRLTDGDPVWSGFLGATEPAVAGAVAAAARRAAGPRPPAAEWEAWVRDAIAPFNVAGLADPARRNLYPVDLAPLFAGAGLLGLREGEARERVGRLRRV